MELNDTIKLDIFYSKISYILACLVSYASLDLSKRIDNINKHILLIKKSIIDNKEYVDIRDVYELKKDLEVLTNKYGNKDVNLDGHKISCLLFEVYSLISLFVNETEAITEDMKEYLQIASQIIYISGRAINIELLSYEDK